MSKCWGWHSHIFSLSNHLNSVALFSIYLSRSLLWVNTMCASVWHSPGYKWDSHYLLKLEDTISAVHFRESTQIAATVFIWLLAICCLCLWKPIHSLCCAGKAIWRPLSPLWSAPPTPCGGICRLFLVASTPYDVWVGCGNKQPDILQRLTR